MRSVVGHAGLDDGLKLLLFARLARVCCERASRCGFATGVLREGCEVSRRLKFAVPAAAILIEAGDPPGVIWVEVLTAFDLWA